MSAEVWHCRAPDAPALSAAQNCAESSSITFNYDAPPEIFLD